MTQENLFRFYCTKPKPECDCEIHRLDKNGEQPPEPAFSPIKKTLFVGNFSNQVDEQALSDLFHCKREQMKIIMVKPAATKKRHAFIHFPTRSQAAQMLDQHNQTELEGQPINVMWMMSSDPCGALKHGYRVGCTLYAGKLNYDTEDKQSARIAKNGYHLSNEGKLEDFVPRRKRQQIQQEQSLNPNPYQPHENLFVKNLAQSVDSSKLRSLFCRQRGDLVRVQVMYHHHENSPNPPVFERLSKGYGLVTYNKVSIAQQALQLLQSEMLDGKPIYIEFAQKKKERKENISQLLSSGCLKRRKQELKAAELDPELRPSTQPVNFPEKWSSSLPLSLPSSTYTTTGYVNPKNDDGKSAKNSDVSTTTTPLQPAEAIHMSSSSSNFALLPPHNFFDQSLTWTTYDASYC